MELINSLLWLGAKSKKWIKNAVAMKSWYFLHDVDIPVVTKILPEQGKTD